MYQKERVAMILNILKENGYVNVKYLCSEVGYSKATINRDLNYMEEQKLVRRSYGGVELAENKAVSLEFRYHKMKNEKKRISKAAANLVEDGDVIFTAFGTTTEYMARYLLNKKDITVITNNISVATFLSDYPNIKTICLGGEFIEPPYMLGGELCVKNILSYKVDKLFFSTHSINAENGDIGIYNIYNLVLSVMVQNAKKIIYMADNSKINAPYNMVPVTVDDVDVIISDYKFSDEFKKRFKNTEFVEI